VSAASPCEVGPGVFRLGTEWANFYLVVEGADALLVDSGYPAYAGQLEAAAGRVGVRPRGISAVIVTHHHVDHVGGLPGVLEWAPRAEVGASEKEAEVITGGRGPDPSSNPLFRFMTSNAKLPTAPVGKLLHEGDRVSGFRVISTPGHTLGHVSLLRDEDGLLFTSDAFGALVRKIRVGGIKALCTDPPTAKLSAQRLLAEDFALVVMGHGPVMRAGARAALRGAVERCRY